ncbi:MAG: patatin-like phospholipase family protein [Bacteroidales bacterium]
MRIKKKHIKNPGIALGGGGARGMAHIGILRAFDEFGLSPKVVSGSSIGGLIAALYAKGESYSNILNHFIVERHVKRLNWFHFKKSLFSLSYLEDSLREAFPIDDFNTLQKELFICVTNLNKGVSEFKYHGPLVKWIMASTAIPVLFEAVEEDKELFIDGGAMNNLPTDPLTGKCDFIIGVDLNSIRPVDNLNNNLLEIGLRSIALGTYLSTKEKLLDCDLVIDPPGLNDFGLLEFTKSKEICEIGYEYTKKKLEALFY